MSGPVSSVQFTLSRGLTWAEREAFKDYLQEELELDFLGHRFHGDNKVVVHSRDDSRFISNEVFHLLGTQFVNVYIKGIHTLEPKVRV